MFRKKEQAAIAPLSPVEQKQAYLNLQAGGEAPLQGFRKAAPEKPRGESFIFSIPFGSSLSLQNGYGLNDIFYDPVHFWH